MLNSILKKFINVGSFFHPFLPQGTCKFFIYIHKVLEIVKCEDSQRFVDHEKRKKTHFHVNVRGQSNFSPVYTQRNVLYYGEFVLEFYKIGIEFDRVVELPLILFIRTDSFREEKYTIFGL